MPPELRAPLSLAEREDIAAAVLAMPGRAMAPARAATVTPLAPRRSRRAWVAAFTLPALAAAGLVLVFQMRSGPDGRLGPLPAYDVEARGGLKELRGAEPGAPATPGAIARPARVGLDSELVVGCRPATGVEGPVAARAFVVRQGGAGAGSAAEVASQVQTAGTGAVEVRLRPFAGVAAAVDPAGPVRWTLRIAVGRPGNVAKLAASDATASAPADGPALRWLTVPLDLVAN